jgi:hypothetical protein
MMPDPGTTTHTMPLTDLLLLGAAYSAVENVFPRPWTVGYATNLSNDGYVVFNTDAATFRNSVLDRLPAGYEFLDYEYTLKGAALSTWHRDVTSGQVYHGTAHPTYTVIRYEYDGDFLTVIPKSHASFPFALARTQAINGTTGTTILFDADLLHAGAPNRVGAARLARQYKVAHRDDRPRLAHLEGVNLCKEGGGGEMTPADWLKRLLSWQLAWLLNLPAVAQRQTPGSFGAFLQRAVNLDFFNRI